MTDLLKCEVTKSGNIVTPKGRGYFVAVAEKFLSKADKAKGKTADKDGAYIVTLCVPANADLSPLIEACKAKAKEKWPNLPGNLKYPIRKCKDVFDNDGDAKYPPEMDDWFQITANTYQQQPGVVDAKGNPLNKLGAGESTDDVKQRVKDECYSGRHLRMSVQPANYDREGNRGVKLYLQNVQVLDHDEPLGGRSSRAEEDFTPVEGVAGVADAGGSADDIFN